MNVCIHRLPLKRSIIHPPSSCPHCGERIRFYDNLPLLSYLFLGGKCRACRHPISWHYPAVEAFTASLSLILFIRYGWTLQYLLFLLFLSALVVITAIDLFHQIIPDVISLPGIAAGWVQALLIGHGFGLDSLIGTVAGGGVLYATAFLHERATGREGLGGGDVKFLAMIGAWMGWKPLPLILLMSSLTGAVIGTLFIVISGKGFRFKIPFGPFLSLGTFLFFFFGQDLTDWYFQLLQ